MEGFYRKGSGARKLIAKEKEGLLQGRSSSFNRNGRGSNHADYLIFLCWVLGGQDGMWRVLVTDYLVGTDQKFSK